MENILEILLPIIIFAAFLFPKLGKKKAQSEGNLVQTKKPKFNIFGKLNKMLEEYYVSDEGEVKRKQKEADPYSWVDGSPEMTEETSEDAAPEPEKQVPVGFIDKKPADSVKKEVKPGLDEQIALPRPEHATYTPSKMRKQDLRKAIVWSEILSPPKALRED